MTPAVPLGGTCWLTSWRMWCSRVVLNPPYCTGKKDITEDLHDLIRDLDSLLAADTISDEQRKWLKFWCKEFWSDEGAAHPLGLSFVSCDQIHLNLLMTGENADSYIDPEHNELGLLASNANLIHSFRKNKKPEDLVRLLQLLMHEKRHLSLGRDLKVASGGLKPGRDIAAAGQAEYRAQEILTTAEELMVARSTLGSEFLVETGVQFKLFRLRNMIRGFVTEQEFKRLRGIIITKLRERYGFTNGCDSSITLGVLTAMERNDWYSCDREKGRVATPIPEGLNICENTLCRTKSSAGTGK
jgi:hypothetical protein